jgi:hypothetical protein
VTGSADPGVFGADQQFPDLLKVDLETGPSHA